MGISTRFNVVFNERQAGAENQTICLFLRTPFMLYALSWLSLLIFFSSFSVFREFYLKNSFESAVCLRLQINESTRYLKISNGLAFWEFALCNIALFLGIVLFIG